MESAAAVPIPAVNMTVGDATTTAANAVLTDRLICRIVPASVRSWVRQSAPKALLTLVPTVNHSAALCTSDHTVSTPPKSIAAV